ncbi:carbohydrate porin [Camelimonas lactis]|uniref:Porin n=1 Tax=Camelimonas lactis TaxID=659006 RepID=A0A4R2GSB0_9HYPH|nr:carbohydrate porin [Camelimonas lactis]TCO13099.1 porin [Camelimonas lactis]
MTWIRPLATLCGVLVAAIMPANAQPAAPAPAPAPEGRRIASETPFVKNTDGAGGDIQTSVAQPETSAEPSANLATSIQDILGPRGDPGGMRAWLLKRGLSYSLTYIGEVLGDASGGMRRGGAYGGRLELQADADLDRLLGWGGASIHANLYQIHGAGLSRSHVGAVLTVSGLEALPSTRLYELWFEQKLFSDVLSIRAGQLAADTEFAVSQTATLFINGTFGWPAGLAANLPGGGPAYPLATPGIRAKYTPDRHFSFQVGLFNGDPAGVGRGDADPQRLNRTGTNFRTSDPPFIIAEAAYAYGLGAHGRTMPGTVTVGGWTHSGRFNDLRPGAAEPSVTAGAGAGPARGRRGDSGVYAMIDQTIYREARDPNDGASAFIRVAASPSDRNLVELYVDAGVSYRGLFRGRSDDTIGLGFAFARISRDARGLDTDAILRFRQPGPRRSSEAVLELTYQAVLAPGVTVQPDFQYVFRPGGGVANPRNPAGARIRNAAIFGLRAAIHY